MNSPRDIRAFVVTQELLEHMFNTLYSAVEDTKTILTPQLLSVGIAKLLDIAISKGNAVNISNQLTRDSSGRLELRVVSDDILTSLPGSNKKKEDLH